MTSLGLGGCRCGFWDAVDGMCITVIIPHGILVWCGVSSFGVGAFGLRVCLFACWALDSEASVS